MKTKFELKNDVSPVAITGVRWKDYVGDFFSQQIFLKALAENKTTHSRTASGVCENSEALIKDIKNLLNMNLALRDSSYSKGSSNNKNTPQDFQARNSDASVFHFYSEDSTLSYWPKASSGAYLSLITLNQDIIKIFDQICEKNLKSAESLGSVQVLVAKQGGYEIARFGDVSVPLLEDNYEPEVVEDFKHIVKDLKAIEPTGRLTIVDGPPGTGKSYFIRGLVNELKGEIIVVLPSKFVSDLDSPSLIPVLLEKKSDQYYDSDMYDFESETPKQNMNDRSLILIIEDADQCLVPRGGDNMSAISTLLNFTDGIFGSVLNMRVIATTNAKNTQLDKALTRPGRLSRRVHIDKLSYAQALKVFERLKGKDITDDDKKMFKNSFKDSGATLAEIYAAVKGVSVGEIVTGDPKLGFNR